MSVSPKSAEVRAKKRSLTESDSTSVGSVDSDGSHISKKMKKCELQSSKQRGIFLVFEGIDRSGKTSQSELLQTYLSSKGISFKHMRFPDRSTEIGKVIDAYLRSSVDLDDRAIHLLFSANRHAVRNQMEQLLENGTHIICDRYTDSGAAYTFGKNSGKQKKKAEMESDEKSSVKASLSADETTDKPSLLSWEFCTESDEGLLEPDIVVYMDITVDEVKKRGGFGDERYEKEEFLTAVLDAYQKLMKSKPDRYHALEAAKSKEDLHNEIVSLFEKTVDSCSTKPIQHLGII